MLMNVMRSFFQTQPAHLLYLYHRGWRILFYSRRELFLRCWQDIDRRWRNTQALIGSAASLHWFKRFWLRLWVICISLYNIVFCLTILLLVTSVVVFSFLALVVTVVLCTCLIVLSVVCTYINAKIKARFYCCPNCHRSMPIPLYLCPTCRREHTRLMPNHYGLLSHDCNCGKRIPTLDFLGRRDLRRYCPYCRSPLHRGIGKGSNVHIPLIGGPSVGKTTYMMMSVNALSLALKSTFDVSVSFPDPAHQRLFQQGLQLLAHGRVLPMTPDQVPSAYNLLFKMPGLWTLTKLLYLYDAQGEVFDSMELLSRQEYYKYTKGIIFMIDPFSIPQYYDEHREEIEHIRRLLRPGTLGVEETYERMIEMLDSTIGFRNRYSIPIAVVINKVDALNLEDEIGAFAAQALMEQDHTLPDDKVMRTVVREFLLTYSLENFINNLENRFSHV